MSGAVLEVSDLDASYGPVQALSGVTLSVDEGEMVALVGANGAGKTTTLRALSGLLSPGAGAIKLKGRDIAGLSAHEVISLGLAHLPEGRELFADLTVVENLRLGAWTCRSNKALVDERLEWALETLPRLKERATQRASTMSGGEQQMLAVARALMTAPQVLLVDELSLGLAPMVVEQLFEVLQEVNAQGTAILLVEQFVHMALKYCGRAYVLARGEIIVEGESSELLASPDLLAAYLGDDVD